MMNENARYRLQRKEAYAMPNIEGNYSCPVHTYRWKDIVVSNDKGALEAILQGTTEQDDYRIVDTWEGIGRRCNKE